MPNRPTIKNLNASSVDILNAIRNSATANYQNYVPVADQSLESVRTIGSIIMDYPLLQNEFLSALVNRIGRVMLTSKSYQNPWAVFKRGMLEFGETIEEIFVNIAKPFQFDPAVAENKVFAREIPDVRAAFHILNYQKFYKATIQNDQLRQAFLSWQGITDLISKIVDSMYAGANYDEFLTMKYLLARHILNGELKPVEVDAADLKGIVTEIKRVSNDMTFMNTDYNLTGVSTYTEKDSQYVIMSSAFDAAMDVEVLAAAFNMSKADFMGHRVLLDSFGSLNVNRLNELFAGDDNYEPLTQAEITALNAIPAVIVDRDWFMIFDNLVNFTEQYNGQGLYWNYWYHVWKTFSVSPFAQSAVFVPGAPSVTAVTISPAGATFAAGQKVNFTATVTATNFAPKAVNWVVGAAAGDNTITPVDGLTVDIYGTVTIGPNVAKDDYTIKATSVYDPSVSQATDFTVA